MDALLMCGGRGTRLDAETEKPLVSVGGVPMVDRVVGALRGSRVDRVYAVVSPHAPATAAHLSGELRRVDAPGDGYVADLGIAIESGPVEPPVLTAAADLPLLAPAAVDRLLSVARGSDSGPTGGAGEAAVASTTTLVPAALKRELGVSVDGDGVWVPAGLNVVGSEPDGAGSRQSPSGSGRRRDHRTWDARLAVNVNRAADRRVAERLSREVENGP
ncbi:MAG: NTP transferase domain-containing protein [Haloferacaceae archaeon]